MSIIASCGHELIDGEVGNMVTIKSYCRDGSRSADYKCVCDECLKWYKDETILILKDESEEKLWFDGKLNYCL